jgi:hypothetical protein
MRKTARLLPFVLLAAACGTPPSTPTSRPSAASSTKPPATTSPSTSPHPVASQGEALLVVLESSKGLNQALDTIAIAGLDGHARAKAHFKSHAVIYGFLSPDGQRVVTLGASNSSVYAQASPPITMPNFFYHSGWIDDHTVAGTMQQSGHVAYVSLANPQNAVDLGFAGQFVGGLGT